MPARPLFAFLVLPAAIASAQGLSWELLPQGAAIPSARQNHTLVYDSHRQRTVLFGGSDTNSIPRLDATWEWTGSSWTQCVAPTSPPARHGHAAAYDSARQRTVIFGGRDIAQGLLADTWEWNGAAWSQAQTGPAPLARIHSAMAFDTARQRTVLFGGWTTSPATGDVILGDTWEWDGSLWSQRATNGASARSAHAMVYDEHAQRTLMFGGSNPATSQRNDLWAWDGVAWTGIQSASVPGVRHHHTMVYDPQRHTTLVQGGTHSFGALRNDTWTWDGTTWTEELGAQVTPARAFSAACYHGTRRRDFLFGGRDGAVGTPNEAVLADAWETSKAMSYSWGSGCPGSNGIPTVVPVNDPVLGGTLLIDGSNMPLPSGLVIGFVGFSNASWGFFPLPMDLSTQGMPGCYLRVAPPPPGLILGTGSVNGTCTWSQPIPLVPSLAGLPLYFQAFVPDAAAGNALGATATNGIAAILGW